ncbi:hypothetical protein [Streptococcus pneumoniae]|nr:hypothetical protein [Streptococcus pneumoniae]
MKRDSCSKHCFEVADGELTKSVTNTYGKAKLTRFEEIFEEYKTPGFSYS